MEQQRSYGGRVFLWQDHWVVLGRLLPNRTHRHISASLLLSQKPFRLEAAGRWRTTRAALVAPDVAQALDPGDSTMLVAQIDPDAAIWSRLRGCLQQQASVDLTVPDEIFPTSGDIDCEQAGRILQSVIQRVGQEPVGLDDRVQRICGQLRQTMPDRLDVQGLATGAGMSASRLTHLFRQHTGVPLRRFLLHLKVTRALGFWQPGKTISQLAAEAGFYDQPHLVRTARAMFDALPSVYMTSGNFAVCRCGQVFGADEETGFRKPS